MRYRTLISLNCVASIKDFFLCIFMQWWCSSLYPILNSHIIVRVSISSDNLPLKIDDESTKKKKNDHEKTYVYNRHCGGQMKILLKLNVTISYRVLYVYGINTSVRMQKPKINYIWFWYCVQLIRLNRRKIVQSENWVRVSADAVTSSYSFWQKV